MKKNVVLLTVGLFFTNFSFAQQRDSKCEVIANFLFGSQMVWNAAQCSLIGTGNFWKAVNCLKLYDMAKSPEKKITQIVNGCEVVMEKIPFPLLSQVSSPEDKKLLSTWLESIREEEELHNLLNDRELVRKSTIVKVKLTITGSDPNKIMSILQATANESLTGTVRFSGKSTNAAIILN